MVGDHMGIPRTVYSFYFPLVILVALPTRVRQYLLYVQGS
jgi:hypothetical protein